MAGYTNTLGNAKELRHGLPRTQSQPLPVCPSSMADKSTGLCSPAGWLSNAARHRISQCAMAATVLQPQIRQPEMDGLGNAV
ncbi:hypothetical protein N7481_011684 [Penicillium waksmanii]|uniref:uncharacterized protein n=1 Tax=Penicillium waksmanii TaxID=69791 RepID=UPI00254951CB|nr:uncharacterized protein N7481_011684 [Penicillium waksmanii]KAJ5974474.1 hypothetical protein N7481_011684 [Penicillium waksmanii]